MTSLLIVGCGNMGGAMLQGWLAGGLDPATITVADPSLNPQATGVRVVAKAPDEQFDLVLVGVKPQALDDVVPTMGQTIGPDTILLSILAGVELDSLASRFSVNRGIVRIMPNLAAAVGKSPLALASRGLDQAGRDRITEFLKPLGTPEWLADEGLFDAVTALAGCGPAFVYRFIDALAAGGVALGLPEGQALSLALATAEGAALLAGTSQFAPDELARRVASPGGATQAGLDVLDAGGALANVVDEAMAAAARRSAEMSQAARKS